MVCWNSTAKIAVGASVVGAATVGMIIIIFTAANWTAPVLWIELIGIAVIGLIGLLWIIIISVQYRAENRRRQNQALEQVEVQPNPAQLYQQRGPDLPTTGYSPKLRDEVDKKERRAQSSSPPVYLEPEYVARVPPSTSEEESTISERADRPYTAKDIEA